MEIGYFLSCEEFTPRELLEQAKLAQRAGIDRLWISDHYHPWNDEQGQTRGLHHAVENARIYTLPDEPPDVLISGFGPKATSLAARVGDGYCRSGRDRRSSSLCSSATCCHASEHGSDSHRGAGPTAALLL